MRYTVISELFSSGIAVYLNSGKGNSVKLELGIPITDIRYFRIPFIPVYWPFLRYVTYGIPVYRNHGIPLDILLPEPAAEPREKESYDLRT